MRISAFCLAASMLAGAATAVADPRPVDTERSTVTVLAYKSGLFSAFAHDHVISAPITSGSVSEEAPLSVDVAFHVANLKVLDPTLDVKRRPEVQTRMLGPEVLDAEAFPEITFASTAVEPAGADKWRVTGRLTIRGRTQNVTFETLRQEGRYRGTVQIKQRDFGIEPISIAGGTVKVKDDIRIQFDIALR
jgi:hypothetical protein